jgi:hypothetical protein
LLESGAETNKMKLSVESNRTDLLQQIQQGTKLRKIGFPPVERTPVPTNPPTTRDNEGHFQSSLPGIQDEEVQQVREL